MWQLRRLSTGENLSDPQPLPNSWRNIFGLEGSIDKLGNLAWAGHPDLGWFQIPEPTVDQKAFVDDQIAHFLMDTAPMVAMDNTDMTKAERQAWMDYRKQLQEIPLQPDYPHEVRWPNRPE